MKKTKITSFILSAILASSLSITVSAATITGAPTNVSASVVNSTTAKVNFLTSSNSSGSGTITYTVTATPSGLSATGSATGISISGLTTGTQYTFIVVGTDGTNTYTSSTSNSIAPTTINTITWSGATSTDWGTASNWVGGVLPGVNSKVSIPSGKTIIIGSGTSVNINSISMASAGSLTNDGTLNIVTKSADTYSFNNVGSTFINTGSLNVNATAGMYYCFGSSGTTNLTFNGSVNLTAGANKSVFITTTSSSVTTIQGAGFQLGSNGSPVTHGLLSSTVANSQFNIGAGTTINAYINGSNNAIYLSNSSTFTNNGTININSTSTGTSIHAIQIWQTTSAATSSVTNNGEFTINGFEQPIILGGNKSNGAANLVNSGTWNITASTTGICIISSGNGANNITNSGNMSLYGGTALSLLANTFGGTVTNTGSLTISKGVLTSSASQGSYSSYQVINNNYGGVINFNFGDFTGSTIATGKVLINNNNGATINGSCTFGENTLATYSGSTLSPGDFNSTTGISGIGIIILTQPLAGTKFSLSGNLQMQLRGKTTAGIDFDQIQCSELDLTNTILTSSIQYTPTINDIVPLTYSVVSKSGSFITSNIPVGWIVDSTSNTEVSLKFIASVPDAPIIGTATPRNSKAIVSFTAPAFNGGSEITSYTITSIPEGKIATGLNSPIEITGLTNGTIYSFTVAATNIRGLGAASTPSNSITPVVTNLRDVLNSQRDSAVINIPNDIYSLNTSAGAYVFSNLQNVTIQGNNSEVICDKQSMAFKFYNCQNIVFSDLSVDYQPLCFTQGVITSLSSDKSTWDFKIMNGYPITNINTSKVELFDPTTLELKRNFYTIYGGDITFSQTGDSTFRIVKNRTLGPLNEAIGDYVVLNVVPTGNIQTHGIFSQNCVNLTMDNITMYGSNCFSFYESECSNSTYSHCKVARKINDPNVSVQRLRSGNADGIHSKHATIGPKILNCRIEHNGDDCIAISGNFYPIYKVDQSNGYVYFLSGETTPKIQSNDSMVCVNNNATIKGYTKCSTLYSTIPTTQEISTCLGKFTSGLANQAAFTKGFRINISPWIDSLTIGDLVYSKQRVGCDFVIQNDTIGLNRSRGILVKASDGLIQNNIVNSCMLAGIVIAPEYYWMEAGCSSNVEINNNHISNCLHTASYWGLAQAGALSVISINGAGQITNSGGFSNISIHDNIINGCPKPNIVLTSINGYSFYNNVMNPDLSMLRTHGAKYGISNSGIIWSKNLSGGIQLAPRTHTQNESLNENKTTLRILNNSICIKNNSNEQLQIDVYTTNGLKIHSSKLTHEAIIPLKTYNPGIYIIRITGNNYSRNQKFIL